MKVFVTGGCGFLGSNICEFYAKRGNTVIAFDNLTKYELNRTGYNVEKARQHTVDFLKSLGVQIVEGDVKRFQDDLLEWEDCDYFIHTAAQPSMTISIESPWLDSETNIMGALNMLELARKHDKPLALCSTIHVYGNQSNRYLIEQSSRFYGHTTMETYPTMQGTLTPLHVSKRCAELYAQSYIDLYGLRVATFRLTGMYGERQFGAEDHGWVANFAIKILTGKPITIYGTEKQVRDILYAKDAVNAFDCFYRHQKAGIYNIGGGMERAISLIECIRLIEDITGKKAQIEMKPARQGDLWYFVCDITKAGRELGWQPKVSNLKGLTRLVKWIRENAGIFEGLKEQVPAWHGMDD